MKMNQEIEEQKTRMFNMKEARDHNTVSIWNDTIWRVFLEGKLFISDSGQTCFSCREAAVAAVQESYWMKVINEYVDSVQKAYNKIGDKKWRNEFLDKIFKNMNLEFREYEYRGEPNNS